MSYILEALKRSEQERHQGELNHATIDTIMMPSKKAKHQWWPYLLILVLVINLFAYLYFQMASDDIEAAEVDVSQQYILPSESVYEEQFSSVELDGKKNIKTERASSNDTNHEKPLPSHLLQTPKLTKQYNLNSPYQAKTTTPVKEERVTGYTNDGLEIIRPKASTKAISSKGLMLNQGEEQSRSQYRNDSVVVEESESISTHLEEPIVESFKVENFDDVFHLNDLDLSFQKSIPDISFNSHIYSINPSDRRVMLNNLYLREGQSFSGMTIETIGEFYLVLSKSSQRFKLPVLRDWFRPE